MFVLHVAVQVGGVGIQIVSLFWFYKIVQVCLPHPSLPSAIHEMLPACENMLWLCCRLQYGKQHKVARRKYTHPDT